MGSGHDAGTLTSPEDHTFVGMSAGCQLRPGDDGSPHEPDGNQECRSQQNFMAGLRADADESDAKEFH
jgi:hypothetical protein